MRLSFLSTIVALLVVPPSVGAQPFAYNVLPNVALSPTKGTFSQFEPVLIVVSIENPSGLNQTYGHPGRLNGHMEWSIQDPNGATLTGHPMVNDTGRYFKPSLTYAPGETKSDTNNFTLEWPLWRETGTYQIQAFFFDEVTGVDVQVASTSFDVSPPQGVAPEFVGHLSDAADLVFRYSPEVSVQVGLSLDTLLANTGSLTAEMVEFTQFIAAVFEDAKREIDCLVPFVPAGTCLPAGADSVQAAYEAFTQLYPDSQFREAAEGGLAGMRLFRGEHIQEMDWLLQYDLTVMLQGAMISGSQMSTTLNSSSQVPNSDHPYSAVPWSWPFDTRDFPASNQPFVDWVLVTVVDAGFAPLAKDVAYLRSDGSVIGTLTMPPADSVRFVVDHRNHVAVAADTMLKLQPITIAKHDFTTGHAFGENRPQKMIVSGQDTVYAMWAADGNCDGIITAPDFDLWNSATSSGASGYQFTDYNMDVNVTAPDFNLWNANSTAGAGTGLSDQLADLLLPRGECGSEPQGLQLLTTGAGSYIRLNVTMDTPHEFRFNVEAKADSSMLPANTIATIVVDVFFDDQELTFASENSPLLGGTDYLRTVQQLEKDGETFLRISYRASSTGLPWEDLSADWTVISQVYFDRSPPKHDPGIAIRPRTVTIGFYDSHANSNGSKRVNETIPEIQ